MQFKKGSWWKACYDEERNLYTVETRGRGTYDLYEIDAETYERLDSPEVDDLETERMIIKGRHLYKDVDDVYSGMPYTHVIDENYEQLCPWARIQNSGHTTPKELTDIAVEYLENEKTREHRKKKQYNIKVSKDEAVVLSELLHRISERDEYYEDIAEQYVLWKIEAQLDKLLIEPCMENYLDIVKESRNIVRKNY